jgi:hypothetical protein
MGMGMVGVALTTYGAKASVVNQRETAGSSLDMLGVGA